MPTFNAEKAATVLLDAAYTDDKRAAEKWNVTERTVRVWRNRLFEDAHFSALFHLKKRQFEAGWANDLAAAIRAGAGFLKQAAESCDPKDVKAIRAVAGAIQICAQAVLTSKVLNVGDAGADQGDGAPSGQVETEASSTPLVN